jgi:mannose-6-phosphate isomerase-like protein (cupin superfamily)
MAQKKSIGAVAASLSRPFTHAVVGKVDDYCAYLSRFSGTYHFHAHNRDEMYLVLEGMIFIEFEDGRRVDLGPYETLVVTAGQMHRSGAPNASLVLLFKACDLFAE